MRNRKGPYDVEKEPEIFPIVLSLQPNLCVVFLLLENRVWVANIYWQSNKKRGGMRAFRSHMIIYGESGIVCGERRLTQSIKRSLCESIEPGGDR